MKKEICTVTYEPYDKMMLLGNGYSELERSSLIFKRLRDKNNGKDRK